MPSRTFLRVASWAALFSAVAIVLMVATAILGATLRLGNMFSVVVVILMALLIVVAEDYPGSGFSPRRVGCCPGWAR